MQSGAHHALRSLEIDAVMGSASFNGVIVGLNRASSPIFGRKNPRRSVFCFCRLNDGDATSHCEA
jgi:hypothetical protein